MESRRRAISQEGALARCMAMREELLRGKSPRKLSSKLTNNEYTPQQAAGY